MKDLTEEEAKALDEYYSTHLPKLGPNEGGFFARRNILSALAPENADYIRRQASKTHRTPEQVLNDLVRRVAVAAL